MNVDRRTLLAGTAAVAAGAALSRRFFQPPYHPTRRPAQSRVGILRASAYDAKLEEILMQGLRLFGLDLSNRSVLLKPNLLHYIPANAINTHPLMFTTPVEYFRQFVA